MGKSLLFHILFFLLFLMSALTKCIKWSNICTCREIWFEWKALGMCILEEKKRLRLTFKGIPPMQSESESWRKDIQTRTQYRCGSTQHCCYCTIQSSCYTEKSVFYSIHWWHCLRVCVYAYTFQSWFWFWTHSITFARHTFKSTL